MSTTHSGPAGTDADAAIRRTSPGVRTPTTVVLDATGAEVTRATGAPTRDQVLMALAQA